MKKLLFGLCLSFCVFAITSCGSDDDDACTTCTLPLPLIGDTVTEICPSGTGVDLSVDGAPATNVPNTTVQEQVDAQELLGASCN